jgi:hypothetical protein
VQPAAEPLKLPFPLQDNETVLTLQRRHWWFLWPMTVFYVILAVGAPLLAVFIFDAIGILDDLGVFFWIPVGLWAAYWAFRAIFNWYRYNNDIWVISNQRIVDSFKPHPLSLRVNTADLVNLQDIKVEKKGLTATMLNYGDVVCQTAGTGTNFVIGGAPRPESLQMMIDRERDRERNRIRGVESV